MPGGWFFIIYILIKRSLPPFSLSFKGQCQQIDEHFDGKGFFNEFVDPESHGFRKDMIIAVGGNQKPNGPWLGNGSEFQKFQAVDARQPQVTDDDVKLLLLDGLQAFFGTLGYL
ncbi:unnamed protein product [marine sediment metagenome]|uniref:Uncharacterized protein n=1 Tax=marine sediment metagenome TaxID=412755 RepID=X1N259_9ZZZZ